MLKITYGHLKKIILLKLQGCAVAEPRGSWCLMFVLGRQENLCFFIQIICLASLISQFQGTGLPIISLEYTALCSIQGKEKKNKCFQVAAANEKYKVIVSHCCQISSLIY